MNRRRFLGSCLAGAALASRVTRAAAVNDSSSNILLLGASTPPENAFPRHAIPALGELCSGARRIFVIADAAPPSDRDRQAERIHAILEEACGESVSTTALHRLDDASARKALRDADGVFVGGGQTFLLLRTLYDRGLLKPLRERVASGLPYAGSSAGSNIAGPVIGTTNDFPVTDVPSRRSLGVFPAVINPHHPPADHPDHAGRAGKILGYLEINPSEVVLGLGEAAMVRTANARISLIAGPGWIYRDGKAEAIEAGAEIGERLR
ncbi:MAG: dipeptidase PepE [Opitutaceae bacterium]